MTESKELVNLRTNNGNNYHPWNREKGLDRPRQPGTASGITSVTGSERERRERQGDKEKKTTSTDSPKLVKSINSEIRGTR